VAERRNKPWQLLTNHAVVLIHVYEHPNSTLREIAREVDITERAAYAILRQLEADDCVRKVKAGRGNRYTVNLPNVLARRTQGRYNIEQIVTGLSNLMGFRPPESD
jgi:DNA-binding IclR family transcriptional regulator